MTGIREKEDDQKGKTMINLEQGSDNLGREMKIDQEEED